VLVGPRCVVAQGFCPFPRGGLPPWTSPGQAPERLKPLAGTAGHPPLDACVISTSGRLRPAGGEDSEGRRAGRPAHPCPVPAFPAPRFPALGPTPPQAVAQYAPRQRSHWSATAGCPCSCCSGSTRCEDSLTPTAFGPRGATAGPCCACCWAVAAW